MAHAHAPAGGAVTGIIPEETEARFLAQHRAAYAFARQFIAGQRVLEVGFGDGHGADYLAETAAEVTGIDMNPVNIPHAQQKYRRPNLRFAHMDGSRLGFPDRSFDVVCSFQVIEHVPEPELPRYLSEISRVLMPEGVFCVSTLNLAHNAKPGNPYEKHPHHEKEFTAPELARLLEGVFPRVTLYGLHLTLPHRAAQRLKKWGLMRWGPAWLNPIARYHRHMSVRAFRVLPDVSDAALDLFAVCRKSA